jgi:hypothetical protein
MSATETPLRTTTSDEPRPSFFVRLFFLAWVASFRTLFDPEFAAGVARLRAGRPALPLPPAPEPADEVPAKATPKKEALPSPVLKEASPDAALQLLALFQREGRLIDFLEEDVVSFSDAQIGVAARVVHEGCRKALREHFVLEPIRSDEEGAWISLDEGFDARAIRLTGKVTGGPPYRGKLAHRGWRAKEVKLPKMAEDHDPYVIAPAEVEL